MLDFGIAKLERSMVETEVGTVKGKLRYMAPEQVAGDKLDRRADIYAAGVILWEALTGERMWKGSSEGEIRARVLAGDLPMSETARPDVPDVAGAHLPARAVARRPGDRHATARQLADELEAAMSELGLAASQREIGAMVARLFEDIRGETKRTIETKLGRASMATGLPAVSDTGETRILQAGTGDRRRRRGDDHRRQRRRRRADRRGGRAADRANARRSSRWRRPRAAAQTAVPAPAAAVTAAADQPDGDLARRDREARRTDGGRGAGGETGAPERRRHARGAASERKRRRVGRARAGARRHHRARRRRIARAGRRLRASVLRRRRRHQEVQARMHVIGRRARTRALRHARIRALLAVAICAPPPPGGVHRRRRHGGSRACARRERSAPAAPSTPATPTVPSESADKAECLSRYEEAQVARRERRLLASRAALRICSGAACPSAVRADCVDWLDQVVAQPALGGRDRARPRRRRAGGEGVHRRQARGRTADRASRWRSIPGCTSSASSHRRGR